MPPTRDDMKDFVFGGSGTKLFVFGTIASWAGRRIQEKGCFFVELGKKNPGVLKK